MDCCIGALCPTLSPKPYGSAALTFRDGSGPAGGKATMSRSLAAARRAATRRAFGPWGLERLFCFGGEMLLMLMVVGSYHSAEPEESPPGLPRWGVGFPRPLGGGIGRGV